MPQDGGGGFDLAAAFAALSGQLKELAGKYDRAEKRALAAEEREKKAVERLSSLESRVADLTADLARADQRQEGLDRARRQASLMFFGVNEGEDAQRQVAQLLRSVDCAAATKMVDAVRLGPARAPAGASPSASRQRPVRVTFATAAATFEVFKACKALREQHKVFVDRDLTVQQRATRTALKEDYKCLRENGYRPFWRSERLFYGAGDGSPARQFKEGDPVPTRVSPSAADAPFARATGRRA